MNTKEKLKNYFGKNLRKYFLKAEDNILERTLEIRIREGREIIFRLKEREYYLCKNGLEVVNNNAIRAGKEDIMEILELMSDYSIYSLEEEIRKGFLTLKGGFRVGISGKCITENNAVKAIKYINGMNIRICREVKGCADKLTSLILRNNIKNILNNDNNINKNIDKILLELDSEKPTEVRQYLSAIKDIVKYKKELNLKIKEKLLSMNYLRYKDSMQGLIFKDIEEVLKLINNIAI